MITFTYQKKKLTAFSSLSALKCDLVLFGCVCVWMSLNTRKWKLLTTRRKVWIVDKMLKLNKMANTKEFLEISQVKTAIATTSFSFSLKRFSFKEEEKNFAHNFIWRTYAFWWTIEFIWIYFVVFGRLHFYTKRANEREYSFDYYSLLMVFFWRGRR